jgi:hypothetical protein
LYPFFITSGGSISTDSNESRSSIIYVMVLKNNGYGSKFTGGMMLESNGYGGLLRE